MPSNPLITIALGCAIAATLILIWLFFRKPGPLTNATRLWLLLGIGVLPIATAATGNVAGFEATKSRRFCGSCHVMTPYKNDSEDPKSTSLAARHSRNQLFGEENCYACHATYGMYGTVLTKLGGLRHVYEYTMHYRNMPLDEAREKIHIRRPYQNDNCMHCHSTEGPSWNGIKDHKSIVFQVRSGSVSCTSEGCHGPAHPFSKPAKPAPTPAPTSTPADTPADAGGAR
jgi:nitrate/TMAO reductase-like tetraheme cytochrome c subunit